MRWLVQITTVVLAFAALAHGTAMRTETYLAGPAETASHGSVVIYKTHQALPEDLVPRVRALSGPRAPFESGACITGQCQDI